MPEQEVNLVQIPHSSKATFKFPPFLGTMHSQMPRVCPGVHNAGLEITAGQRTMSGQK